jgi:hypothetical protein
VREDRYCQATGCIVRSVGGSIVRKDGISLFWRDFVYVGDSRNRSTVTRDGEIASRGYNLKAATV